MARAIRIRDLSALSRGDRERAMGGLIGEARAPVNGQAFVIKAKIQGYESRYEMTSEQLHQRLRMHEMRETAEVRDWLFWLRLKELCGG